MSLGITFLVFAALPFVQMKALKPLDEDMFLYWRRSDSGKCAPFTTYMLGCNKCICSADGTSYCTRMACFAEGVVLNKIEERTKTAANTEEDKS